MKRTPLRRYTPLKTYGNAKILKQTPLNRKGKSETTKLKETIQWLLREIVIKRDKKCIRCGVSVGTPGIVWQCDHLISRANSATYADSRLCTLICQPCHAWKSLGSNLRKAEYDALVKTILPQERVQLWERMEKALWRPVSKRSYDWRLEIAALEQELATYE